MAKVDLGQVVGADGKDALIDETVTGKIASFSDGCVGMPMKSIVAEITPVQSGSGDPSPDNIRPISGRTGLTVTVQSGETQNEYPVTWETEAGTVYGGTLDVVSGVLTVDRAIVEFDGSSADSWSFAPAFTSFSSRAYITVPGIDVSTADSAIGDLISNAYPTYAYSSNSVIPRISTRHNIDQINVFVPTTTREEFISSLVSEPLQVVYKLATPQTYQLTPTEVRTLLGENLVYSDAGDVTVNYYVDTKDYIDKRLNTTRMMIAGVETSFVATKNYAIGDFVIVNDTLYRITAVITSGETITPGTNASETTVAEQLIALYNA